MKRTFILVLLLTLSATVSISRAESVGVIGLYSDEHPCCCVNGTEFPYVTEMWIWCLPSPGGMKGVEFGLDYPDNLYAATLEKHDEIIALDIEELPDLWAIILTDCQRDWFWLAKQIIIVNSKEKTMIEPVAAAANPGGTMVLLTCEPSAETELFPYTKLLVNMNPRSRKCYASLPVPESAPATKVTTIQLTPALPDETSWGAIKELYK